jgi:hypothetical protein
MASVVPWALDACGGCGTKTAAWVGPLIIVVVLLFLVVVIAFARRQSLAKRAAQATAQEAPASTSDRNPD